MNLPTDAEFLDAMKKVRKIHDRTPAPYTQGDIAAIGKTPIKPLLPKSEIKGTRYNGEGEE